MEAKTAVDTPAAIELEAGKKYFWCVCGFTKTQPFCDGLHKEVNKTLHKDRAQFRPLRFSPEKDRKAWVCRCKHTKTPPYCDGTHKAH